MRQFLYENFQTAKKSYIERGTCAKDYFEYCEEVM